MNILVELKNRCSIESGNETELFLPDEYYQNLNKDIQNGYQTPNTREVYKRLGNTSHEVETSIVISNEFGRIKYRINYSIHGNNLAHTNPHIHEFVPNLTKADDFPRKIKYFMDSNTGKMFICWAFAIPTFWLLSCVSSSVSVFDETVSKSIVEENCRRISFEVLPQLLEKMD